MSEPEESFEARRAHARGRRRHVTRGIKARLGVAGDPDRLQGLRGRADPCRARAGR